MTLTVNDLGPRGEGDGPHRLLVLLHGYGADEHDLAPLAPLLDPTGRFHVVCPRGPHSVMGFGAGWYERGPEGEIDPDQFVASVDAIDATIAEVAAGNGLDRSRAVVIGFSQGGAMTLASGLRRDGGPRPAAIACLSGMLQEVPGLDYDFDDPPAKVLVHHGTLDPLVPVDRGRRIAAVLTEHGVAHEYREYPMEHDIAPASVVDLHHWLATA